MPIHDWTRVSAGTWHDFHLVWIAEMRNTLNSGLLPPDYYVQAEQIAGPLGPDVLTLQTQTPDAGVNGPSRDSSDERSGVIAVAISPPRARLIAEAEMIDYVLKRRTLVIRHSSDDRIVALIEIVSPGNKAGRAPFRAFVEKAVEAIYRGYHLLVVDLFPPTKRDPHGIHAAIWGEFSDELFEPPPDRPLTLAAYSAGPTKRAYVEPTAVGRELLEMPLFLEPDSYVNVPLEETYHVAYAGMPRRWSTILDAP